MPWPDGSDLEAYLAASQVEMPDGSAVPATIASDALMAAAAILFGEKTGWVPFIGEEQTRTFDPPGRPINGLGSTGGGGNILRLNAGLLSVSSLTIGGVAKTEGTDFYLMRHRPDMPAYAIRFRSVVYGEPGDISIEGDWGRMADSDDAANQAVLNLGAQMACYAIRDGIGSGGISWDEADVKERFSVEMVQKLGDGFGAIAAPFIDLYRRVTVGV